MDKPILENEQDVAKRAESGSTPIESKGEVKESDFIRGAEMLETPPQGDFIQGFRKFVAWVNSLIGKK